MTTSNGRLAFHSFHGGVGQMGISAGMGGQGVFTSGKIAIVEAFPCAKDFSAD